MMMKLSAEYLHSHESDAWLLFCCFVYESTVQATHFWSQVDDYFSHRTFACNVLH
jgi:hypothetical protein